ncbi:hypothetical protein AYO41_04800 [Verrucomicrobia bacterium SCGC AG-212-E04]|nr:hypothetical protein AYO41_04800 [Verrucomicrobia bacterium SCGC AG-212-E04]
MKVAPLDLPPVEPGPEPRLEEMEVEIEPVDTIFSRPFSNAMPPPPQMEEVLEIDASSFGIQLPEVQAPIEPSAATQPSAGEYQDLSQPLLVSPPPVPRTAPVEEIDPLDLDLVPLPDLFCPKCLSLIPESHHGSYYTECPKCSWMIKMK